MRFILNISKMVTNEVNKFYAKEQDVFAAEIFHKSARVEIIDAETGEIIADSWDEK